MQYEDSIIERMLELTKTHEAKVKSGEYRDDGEPHRIEEGDYDDE